MKLKGKITIFINPEVTRIEVRDDVSATTFLEIELTAEQLASALGRIGNTECELEVMGLDRVGRELELSTIEFEVPERLASSTYETELQEIAQEILDVKKEGWIADKYFGSSTSFFRNGFRQFARTTIRRWI